MGRVPRFTFSDGSFSLGPDVPRRQLFPIGGAAPDNSEQYLWYASWLLKDDVWISKDKTQILKGGKPILSGTNVDWHNLPQFKEGSKTPPYYTFDNVSADSMEAWAERSAWIADFLRGLLNLLNIGKGDIAANLATGTLDTGLGVFKRA
jgi:hypothetical protein